MAAGDLTTLSAVEQWLYAGGVVVPDPNPDAALLATLITAASQFIQTWIGRQLASASYSEIRSAVGSATMMFANTPVTAVSSLSINGMPIPASSGFGVSGYAFDEKQIWLTGYYFTRGLKNVTMSYTAGYSTIPPELAQACTELVGVRYKDKDRIGMTSQSVSQQTTSYSQKDMPADVLTMLQRYRKVITP